MITTFKPLAQRRRQATKVMLDVGALDAPGQSKWSTFIKFSAKTLEIEVSIGSFSGMPPDDRLDFAYVIDSGALSRKLLLNFSLIYIQPRSAPAQIDTYFYWKSLELFGRASSWHPVAHSVTLISSVFRGDEFLSGFLDNCMALQDYENCEHFLIRAGSPGNEHARLVEHVRQCPSAVYLNLAEDPGLYEVWNLGSRLATSRYLSNANIDDRRAPDHVRHLKKALDVDPDVTVASTALRVSKQRNLEWKNSGTCHVWFGDVGDVSVGVEGLFEQRDEGLVSRNFLHCMPLWRRNMHARAGGFDEKNYGPSADWAFWVHAGFHGAKFHLSAKPLGLYLRDEESYWRRAATNHQNDQRIVEEFAAWASLGIEPVRRHRSISRELSDAISLLSKGAVYEGLGRFLDVALQSARLGETEHALLHRVAMQFLGCNDLLRLLSRFQNTLESGELFDRALFNAWTDLVCSLDSPSARVRHTLEFACVDLIECTGDFRGLLLRAFWAHKQGNLAFEQILRQHLHETDSNMFWNTFFGAVGGGLSSDDCGIARARHTGSIDEIPS